MGGHRDWDKVEMVADGVDIVDTAARPLHFSDVSTLPLRKRGNVVSRPPTLLHKVGMDIGYGSGIAVGGQKYCLMLVDATSRKKWVYGLVNLQGTSIVNQLQQFFIDVGRVPHLIQTDFDPKFLGGAVANLCLHKGIQLRASPPNQKSKNGLVESSWKQVVITARALLLEANLPKRFWFWAAREAALRIDMQPVTIPAPANTPGGCHKICHLSV